MCVFVAFIWAVDTVVNEFANLDSIENLKQLLKELETDSTNNDGWLTFASMSSTDNKTKLKPLAPLSFKSPPKSRHTIRDKSPLEKPKTARPKTAGPRKLRQLQSIKN